MINAATPSPSSVPTPTMTPRGDSRNSDESDDKYSETSSTSSHGFPEKPVSDAPASPKPDAGEGARVGEDEEDWSKLRCESLCTEELARKEKQKQDRANRRNRCADYPGFAFGSAMFGSDTTMKFNIIKNELHNIMRSQLKRVEGEVNALSSRIKQFDEKLEESEKYIREATAALADAVALQIEESKNRSADDEQKSNLSAFDQHVLFLEVQLQEARIKATQSFQILEDCHQEQMILLKDSNVAEQTDTVDSTTGSEQSQADETVAPVSETQMSGTFAPVTESLVPAPGPVLGAPAPVIPPPVPISITSRTDEFIQNSRRRNLSSEPTDNSPPNHSNHTRDSFRVNNGMSSQAPELKEPNNNITVDNSKLCEDNMNANITGAV